MSIMDSAVAFFEACETGKGWEVCSAYCAPDARFSAQAHALDGVETVEAYTNWMRDFMVSVPDGTYEVIGFGEDKSRSVALVYAIFSGTLPASDNSPARPIKADYVYSLSFENGKIVRMVKIWNDSF